MSLWCKSHKNRQVILSFARYLVFVRQFGQTRFIKYTSYVGTCSCQDLPGHELEDVEVGVRPEQDDEDDEAESQRLQDPDQKLGHPWQVPA
jgi:hypothetical protein